jgi:hypothetical protein
LVEHLVPVHPSGHPRIDEYLARVAEVLRLDRRADTEVVGSAMCLPSFDPEWVLHLLRPVGGHCSIELIVATTNIWFTEAKVPIIHYCRDIPPDVLGAVEAIWGFVLENAQVDENAETGLDGTTYHFYQRSPSRALQAGKTWSPDPHTTPGRVVTLLHALHEFTVNGANSYIPQWLWSWWSLGKITRATRLFHKHLDTISRCGLTRELQGPAAPLGSETTRAI